MAPKQSSLPAAVGEVLRDEAHWRANPGKVRGEDVGLGTLNQLLGGLNPGLTLLGARTSHGKSALGTQMMLYIASTVYREWESSEDATPPGIVIVVSPEMNPGEIVERHACFSSRVASAAIRDGTSSEEERIRWRNAAQEVLLFQPILRLYAGESISWRELQEILVDAAEEHQAGRGPKIRGIFVDHLQRLHWGMGGVVSQAGEYAALAQIANEMKAMANKYKLPLLVASQLNRGVERDNRDGKQTEREPDLADLHGGTPIEAAADCVMLLHRPPAIQISASGAPQGQQAMVYVKKNRHGPVGEKKLEFWPALVSFSDPLTRPKRDGGL